MDQKAAFRLENYSFNKVTIDLEKRKSKEITISFEPAGKYTTANSVYELNISVHATTEGSDQPFTSIQCLANFSFEHVSSFDEIPSYFYRNAIAIIFPYLRAFVSTVTLQANIPPVILPTMNLSSLEKPLRDNTIQI